jgi:hypothetical protein
MNGILSLFLQLLQSRGTSGDQRQSGCGGGPCEPADMSCMKSMNGCSGGCDSACLSDPMSGCGGSFDDAMTEFGSCGSGCGAPVMAGCCG